MDDVVGKMLLNRRIKALLPLINGRLLDIGCGTNILVRSYGNGIGVDVFDWGNVDMIVKDTSKLPFEDEEFDTITIVAALNHIPNRKEVIIEAKRLLKNDGRLIITMITPTISKIWHKIRAPWDVDQKVRGMQEGEVFGFSSNEIGQMFEDQGFILVKRLGFMLKLNNVYVFKKKN